MPCGRILGREDVPIKLAICGPSRCGKDECGLWLAKHTTLRYRLSTSEVIIPFAAAKIGISHEEMFRRRHEYRNLMLETGRELRKDDPAFLARKVLEHGDLCVGVRDREEMNAVRCENLVDLAIWIDRDVPPDATLGFTSAMCEVVIQNHWGLYELHARLERLARTWGILRQNRVA